MIIIKRYNKNFKKNENDMCTNIYNYTCIYTTVKIYIM